MSHLKKLSDVLKKVRNPTVQEIRILGKDPQSFIDRACLNPISITKNIKDLIIPSLLMTASRHGLCSLSANQIGFNTSAFIIHKTLENDKWSKYESTVKDFNIYLNPLILEVNQDTESGFEYCPSLPHITTQVERNTKIILQYMNFEGEYIEEELNGFKARLAQHETDHVTGFLMSSFSVSFGRIKILDKEKIPTLEKILEDFKEHFENGIVKHEKYAEKYLSEPKEERPRTHKDYVQRMIVDNELEKELGDAIKFAYSEDLNEEKGINSV
ncbi:hypothetical protein SteCoe_11929 [Stentor coeruleus]|uniref:Peptide deformylase n=1 Tax=Stentor coeruleus TaxID=5963 RepID=A0A1R2CBY4_9CILI|nr:hypothetical protein SteCoe_11929 [Stentor coeruleus]